MLTEILSYAGVIMIMENEVFCIPTLKLIESDKPVLAILP
ncbi:hypothetical protein SDC9_114847 [bioreactor metagenome]|uniref:Uncharacterized protein n=1 Tax=bioreactor metagenome TaxID=1076179 RepID=A0A645BRS4_9ZZZZ